MQGVAPSAQPLAEHEWPTDGAAARVAMYAVGSGICALLAVASAASR
jgi:hypothetical protein